MNTNLPLMAEHRICIKLNIKKSNNNLENWQEFYDEFKSAIHGNVEITKIDKFTYLKNLQIIGANCHSRITNL